MPDRVGPRHFVIVGAQRCGTTYLYQLLDEHPDIEMAKPVRPEPKFFLDDDRYPRGLAFYESEFFSERDALVRGEKSTSYIESEVAARRIAELLPDAPVVVVLRDPVARAVSNFRFSTKHGVEDLPIAEALEPAASERAWDPARFSVSPFAYLARGRYVEYLDRLASHIARDRIRVLLFEELVADAAVIADLYRDLGVDASFTPAGLGTAVNTTEPDAPVEAAMNDRLREYFREPNRKLEAFLGRSLPWPG